MYIVKIGEYYVKSTELIRYGNTRTLSLNDILLSKEIMKNFDKNMAEMVAKKVNGEVIELADEVTQSEEKYKQLSIFDEEVSNG